MRLFYGLMTAWVYILASRKHGTLYVGVTNNLARRVHEHRDGRVEGFTKRHEVKVLVFYELHETMPLAIHSPLAHNKRQG